MKENVHVKIVGIQSGGDLPETDRTVTETDGILSGEADAGMILYREQLADGPAGEHTIFKFSKREATLIRKGATAVTMSFVPGEVTASGYNTPFGRIDLSIETLSVSVETSPLRTCITLIYKMSVNEGPAMDCKATVTAVRRQ